MSSKLIHSEKPFFSKMVVDAVLSLDQDQLDESLIGVKKIPGGGMQDSLLINGVSFKKTFTYAGAEQQPKSFVNPLILSLNVELELKAEKDNAEVRVDAVSDYQAIVETPFEVLDVRWRPSSQWSVNIAPLTSHPITAELGVATQTTWKTLELRMGIRIARGQVVAP